MAKPGPVTNMAVGFVKNFFPGTARVGHDLATQGSLSLVSTISAATTSTVLGALPGAIRRPVAAVTAAAAGGLAARSAARSSGLSGLDPVALRLVSGAPESAAQGVALGAGWRAVRG